MKKLGIRLVAGLLVIGSLLVMAGCGKEKKTNDNKEQYIYTAEASRIELNCKANGYPKYISVERNKVVFIENCYDEETMKNSTILHENNLETQADITTELESLGDDDYVVAAAYEPSTGLYAICEKYAEDGNNKFTFVKYDTSGKIQNKTDISSSFAERGIAYISGNFVVADNQFVFGYDNGIAVLDFEGNFKGTIVTSGWVDTLTDDGNGNIYASGFFGDKYAIKKIDVQKFETQDTSINDNNLNGSIFADSEGNIYSSNDSNVTKYSLASGEKTALWNWLDVDVSGYPSVQCLWDNKDDSYGVIISEYDDSTYEEYLEILNIKKELVSEDNQREIITLGCLYMPEGYRTLVSDFNKSNSKYRIVMKSYMDEYDYEEAQGIFNTDIANGSIDLICDETSASLVSKKAFLDLSKYWENDPDIKDEDFFMNVIDIGRYDDKLYSVSPYFQMTTLVANKELVDGLTSWTIDDVIRLCDEHPGREFIAGATKEMVLYYMMIFGGNDVIDIKNNKCNFNNDEFKKLLEFSNRFPKEIDYENYSEFEEIQKGNVMAAMVNLYDFQSALMYYSLFGEKSEKVFIGFPTSTGTGHTITTSGALSISSKSDVKDGAWEFIKYVMMKDEISSMYAGLPVRKKAYENFKKQSLNNNDSEYTMGDGHISITVKKPTQEDIDVIDELISNTNATSGASFFDEKVFEIMDEEIQSYFEGQKTVDEICDILQSRISIYLAESK